MSFFKVINALILILVIIIPALILNRKVKTKKRRFIYYIIITMLLAITSSLLIIPIENSLIKFETPESVFSFNHSEEIIDVVYGNDSCLVIYKSKISNIGLYDIPKYETGYKLSRGFSLKNTKNIIAENAGTSISIYRISGTNDYYIIGDTLPQETQPTIINNKNETINNLVFEANMDNKKCTVFYDFIGDYEIDEYYLMINDNIVFI